MTKIKYSSESKEKKILEVFVDQKLKYNISELPTSKISGLTRINFYVCTETLAEMQKKGLIKISKTLGEKIYWALT